MRYEVAGMKLAGNLKLMVIDMLTLSGASRNQNRTMSGIESAEGASNTRVRDDDVGARHRRVQFVLRQGRVSL
jgi:hypothetical protein